MEGIFGHMGNGAEAPGSERAVETESNNADKPKVTKPFQRRRARRACTACHEVRLVPDLLYV